MRTGIIDKRVARALRAGGRVGSRARPLLFGAPRAPRSAPPLSHQDSDRPPLKPRDPADHWVPGRRSGWLLAGYWCGGDIDGLPIPLDCLGNPISLHFHGVEHRCQLIGT